MRTTSYIHILKHELVLWYEVLQIWTWTCWKQHPSWLLPLSIRQLYPYYYSVCVCPVPGCLCTYCVQYYGLIPRLLCLLQPKQKTTTTTTTTTTTKKKNSNTPPFPSFPISHLLLFQILFLLCMYSIAIARLSHKPSWAGCISCRWH